MFYIYTVANNVAQILAITSEEETAKVAVNSMRPWYSNIDYALNKNAFLKYSGVISKLKTYL